MIDREAELNARMLTLVEGWKDRPREYQATWPAAKKPPRGPSRLVSHCANRYTSGLSRSLICAARRNAPALVPEIDPGRLPAPNQYRLASTGVDSRRCCGAHRPSARTRARLQSAISRSP